MKSNIIILAAATVIISACQPKEKGFDGTSLKGTILPSEATWSAGDSIGVVGTVKGNHLFVLDSRSSGQNEGIFTGDMIGETPVAAYYPYNISAGSTAMESVQMTLPSEQNHKETGPDPSYDVKVAGTPEGSVSQGFTFKFQRKLALVRIDLIPDSKMNGQKLIGITLETKNHTLSGKYSLNLKDPSAGLDFTVPQSYVNVSFGSGRTLQQGSTVSSWVVINPDIAEEDSIFVSFPMEKETLVAKLKSAWTIEAGGSYTFTMDIQQLRNDGKIFVDEGEGTIFTKIEKYGVFNLSGGSITSYISYLEGENQYSVSTSSYHFFSITDIEKGRAFKVRSPKTTTQTGTTYSLQVSFAGIELPARDFQGTLVKISGNMYWFEDKTNKVGFIIYK